MKQILSETDRVHLDKLIAEAELQTKAQIVLATVKRSDNYAEIPWKAFAFGSSIAGLAVFLLDLVIGMGNGDYDSFPGCNNSCNRNLICVPDNFISGICKAVSFRGAAGKPRQMQYAESLFLSRELFATEGRRGILLLDKPIRTAGGYPSRQRGQRPVKY